MFSKPICTATISLAFFLTGCTTPVSTNIKASPADLAKYSNLSDLEVVKALDMKVNEAQIANMPFLAPHYFHEAEQVLNESKSGLGNKPKDVLVNNAAKA